MENIDTSGFYKQTEDGAWMHAPNFVYGLNFELTKDNKDAHTYPVDGWQWYDENIETYKLIYQNDNVEETSENKIDS
jgi:hypothetical protein